jgi:hypothetical protein
VLRFASSADRGKGDLHKLTAVAGWLVAATSLASSHGSGSRSRALRRSLTATYLTSAIQKSRKDSFVCLYDAIRSFLVRAVCSFFFNKVAVCSSELISLAPPRAGHFTGEGNS